MADSQHSGRVRENKPVINHVIYVAAILFFKSSILFFRSRSVVVAADESLIAWGPSPTYGELVRKSIWNSP